MIHGSHLRNLSIESYQLMLLYLFLFRPRCKQTVSSPVIDISSSTFTRSESRWSRLSRRPRRSLEGYVSPSFVGIQVRKFLHFSEVI